MEYLTFNGPVLDFVRMAPYQIIIIKSCHFPYADDPFPALKGITIINI